MQRWLLRGAGRLAARALLLAIAGGILYYGGSSILETARPKILTACVVTDFQYREEKPDWEKQLPQLFDAVNLAFRPIHMEWRPKVGGDAYAPNAEGDMRSRSRLLPAPEECKADVVLGLTGRADPSLNSVVAPFVPVLLLKDTAANTTAMSAILIARGLASIYGISANARAMVLEDAAQSETFDTATLKLLRAMRNFPIAQGAEALPGRWEQRAADALTSALSGKREKPAAEAHRILADAYLSMRRHGDAARQLGQAVNADPKNLSLRLALAVELKANSDSEAALAQLKVAAALDPQNAQPHALAGVIYENGLRYDRAIEEFRTAIQLNPQNSSLQDALREVSTRAGKPRQLSAAFGASVQPPVAKEPAFSAFLLPMGVEETLQDAAARAEAQSSDADVHLRRGLAHAYAGELAAAVQEVQQAIELQPRNGEAHLVLSRIRYLMGQFAAADAELAKAASNGAAAPPDMATAIRRHLTEPAK
jgi:tetratricopeptide (TPR) repeat protein